MSRIARDRFDRMVKEAEEAVEELQPAFEAELERAADRLAAVWSASKSALSSESSATLFSIAHNLKGQGRSFGFDLLTDMAASLCDLLSAPRNSKSSRWRPKAIDVHVRSLRLIAQKKIRGDGGPFGRELLSEVGRLSAKAL